MVEFWKPVHGYEGAYEVSSLGLVRSLPRYVKHKSGHTQHAPGRLLKQILGSHGYPTVCLSAGGKAVRRTVHSIVAEAFIGPRPDGQLVRHLDGNALRPVADNLCYGTPKENQTDRFEHGTANIGEANPSARLTARDVLKIRRAKKDGRSFSSIASSYGISEATARDAVSGRTWGHV